MDEDSFDDMSGCVPWGIDGDGNRWCLLLCANRLRTTGCCGCCPPLEMGNDEEVSVDDVDGVDDNRWCRWWSSEAAMSSIVLTNKKTMLFFEGKREKMVEWASKLYRFVLAVADHWASTTSMKTIIMDDRKSCMLVHPKVTMRNRSTMSLEARVGGPSIGVMSKQWESMQKCSSRFSLRQQKTSTGIKALSLKRNRPTSMATIIQSQTNECINVNIVDIGSWSSARTRAKEQNKKKRRLRFNETRWKSQNFNRSGVATRQNCSTPTKWPNQRALGTLSALALSLTALSLQSNTAFPAAIDVMIEHVRGSGPK